MAQNNICMKSLVLHVSRWVPNANLRVPRWEEFHMGTWGRANFCHSKLVLNPCEMLGVWPSPCLAKICSTLTACMDFRPPRPERILDPHGMDGFSTPTERRGSAEGQNPSLGPGVGKISAVSQDNPSSLFPGREDRAYFPNMLRGREIVCSGNNWPGPRYPYGILPIWEPSDS